MMSYDNRVTAARKTYTTSLDGEHLVLALEEAAQTARTEALEEAASIVDRHGYGLIGQFLAGRIRALKGTR
jgi:hypothetical protein